MNELEYVVREKDLILFNESQYVDSPGVKIALRRHQVMFPAMISLMALFMWFYYQTALVSIGIMGVAILWSLVSPWTIRQGLRRQTRRLYSEEDKKKILGVNRLCAERKVLIEASQDGETTIDWGSILRVVKTKKHAFIYTDVDAALIVPRDTVTKGDFDQFVQIVEKRMEESD